MLKNIIALKHLISDNMMLNQIIKEYSAEEISNLLKGDLFLSSVDPKLQLNLSNKEKKIEALEVAESILKKNEELGIRTLTILDEEYPSNLKKQLDCPTVVYIKGNFKGDVYQKALGCVGTRTPSIHGIRAVNALVPKWTMEDFVIVAGLAEGIDSESHNSCLENGGITIAVLGHGLDMIYPKTNEELAEKIINNDGLLLSEYPVGTKPKKYFFVNRNKIICGLSEALIVFEAALKSGTMHSVNYAIDQNKYIFCPVPVDKEIVQVEAINYLLTNNKAIGIKNKYEFHLVLEKLGHLLKEGSWEEIKKQEYFYSIGKKFQMVIEKNITKQKAKHIAEIAIDEEFYQMLCAFAEERGMAVQDVFDMLIINGRDRSE